MKTHWFALAVVIFYIFQHCVANGFKFHYVKEDILILSLWLPTDVPSRLPLGPSHQIGVGAVVLKPDDPTQMLVVQEITGPAASIKLWKMPTGLVDPQEDISDASIRELKEETGLDAELEGILCFRQAHFENRSSDLFFVCQMRLKDPTQEWKPQPEEIKSIQWMKVSDFSDQEVWKKSPLYQKLNDCILKASKCAAEKLDTVDGNIAKSGVVVPYQLQAGFTKGTNTLYMSQL